MFTSFDEMPDYARLWVYQAERKMSSQELEFVRANTSLFIDQWKAHGQDLRASFDIKHDQFLILSVDESQSEASGCSIDASVHLIKALEDELKISFMTSGHVAFLQNDEIKLYPFGQLKSLATEKVIEPETTVFDNTVQNLGDFRKRWTVESKDSWVKRYFR